jgi:hypothetical protein
MGRWLPVPKILKREKAVDTTTLVVSPPAAPVQVEAARSSNVDVPTKVFVYDTGARTQEYSWDDPRIADILNGAYSDYNFIELFNCVPEIAAPVHEIASRVADATWQLKKTFGSYDIDKGNAQFNRLFTQPNPLQSFRDFVYQAVCYELLTGKQFFFANVPSAFATELANVSTWSNLPAHRTRIVKFKGVNPHLITDISQLIQRYETPGFNGSGREIYTPDRVYPVVRMALDKDNDIACSSALIRGADKAIRNLLAVYEARGVIYLKRGHLGILVSAKSDDSGTVALTSEEKKEIEEDLQDRYGLRRDKSLIAITNQPLNYLQTTASISDLQPFDETLQDAVSIYKVLSVPRHLVPSKDSSTFANADADMKEFYNSVIIPYACKFAMIFTDFLRLSDIRRVIVADFSHILQIQENRMERAKVDQINGQTYQQAFTSGVCTLNDWIAARGGTKQNAPLYNKLIFDMTPEEQAIIKSAYNLKSPVNVQTATENSGSPTPSNAAQSASA